LISSHNLFSSEIQILLSYRFLQGISHILTLEPTAELINRKEIQLRNINLKTGVSPFLLREQ